MYLSNQQPQKEREFFQDQYPLYVCVHMLAISGRIFLLPFFSTSPFGITILPKLTRTIWQCYKPHLDQLHNKIHFYKTRLTGLGDKAVSKVFGVFMTSGHGPMVATETMEK